MKFNFDELTERYNTDSIKFDFAAERGKPEKILPLWVADMDFKSPPCIVDALVNRAKHGIFGYTQNREDYFHSLEGWFSRHFDWQIKQEWLLITTGVVNSLALAVAAYTKEGDSILIQQPVYYPFAQVVKIQNRKLCVNELKLENGKYHIDFEDFENKIKENKVKLFILCSPHNPVGRVWTKEELLKIGEICLKYNVIVISDEIHMDFSFEPHRHFVFASLSTELADITVTCTAPTKTFNIPGLQIANTLIGNSELRNKFKMQIAISGYSQPNVMGVVACRAAYEKGDEWLFELKQYLKENIDFAKVYLREHIPDIKIIEPEGTYLLWLDFRSLGFTDDKIDDFLINKAGLWLNAGRIFGAGGEGFQRMNIASPKSIIEKALIQLDKAMQVLK